MAAVPRSAAFRTYCECKLCNWYLSRTQDLASPFTSIVFSVWRKAWIHTGWIEGHTWNPSTETRCPSSTSAEMQKHLPSGWNRISRTGNGNGEQSKYCVFPSRGFIRGIALQKPCFDHGVYYVSRWGFSVCFPNVQLFLYETHNGSFFPECTESTTFPIHRSEIWFFLKHNAEHSMNASSNRHVRN